LQQAVLVAETINEHTPQRMALMSIAEVEVLRGDVPAALKLADKIQAERSSPSFLAQVVRAQAEAGDPEGALKTAAIIDKREMYNGLSAIAAVQAKAGNIPGALRTADLLKHQPLVRGSALEAVAVAQAKSGNRDEAKRTLEEAKRLILSVIAPQGEAQALANFAVCQAEIGDIEGGLRTLNDLNLEDDKTFADSKA
jgi:tetratricopeptide (TPR) repeat protein